MRDVKEIIHISAYALRDWEKKFSMLKPSKSKSGRRLYRKRDLDVILKIKKLKETGYNDEKINDMLKNPVPENIFDEKTTPWNDKKNQDLIAEINHDLKEILKLLDDR